MTPQQQVEEVIRITRGLGDVVVIAGGCLRDIALGREPKDIDVFINSPSIGALAHGWAFDTASADISKYETSNSEIDAVLGIVRKDGNDDHIPIQAIYQKGLAGPAELIGRFDFGICQIATTNGRDRIFTKQFRSDLWAQKLTYVRGIDELTKVKRNNAWVRARRFMGHLGFDLDVKSMPPNPKHEVEFNDRPSPFGIDWF